MPRLPDLVAGELKVYRTDCSLLKRAILSELI